MKRNLNVAVRDHEGNPHVRAVMKYDEKTGMPVMETINGVKQHAFARHEAMTLRHYALDALCGLWPGDEALTGDERVKRMRIHDKICFAGDKDVELESQDLPVILTALERQRVSPLVYVRMKDFLEADPAPQAATTE